MSTKHASFSEHINKYINKDTKRASKGLVCEYCGETKEEVSFFIGAAKEADWCMHEGTGKISCPDCYGIAQEEAK